MTSSGPIFIYFSIFYN